MGQDTDTDPYLDQRDLFSKLQHFKPMQALTAADLSGLDPEDIQFLVNAQMTGNEQQRLMFGTAINHLQMQQQRVDSAKTEGAKIRARSELEQAKQSFDLMRDEINFQRELLLEDAKLGNRHSIEQAKHMLSMNLEMYKRKTPTAKHPEEIRKLDAEARKIEAELAKIQSGEDDGLNANQRELKVHRDKEAMNKAMQKIFDPETPESEKQYIANSLNTPDSPVYYHYQSKVPRSIRSDIPGELVQYPIPRHPVTGKQLTMQEISADLYEYNQRARAEGRAERTMIETLERLRKIATGTIPQQ